ncbi:uncharacterized protein EDB91DRAFT_1144932 [Suillus paluster]|uniref:uncharacterized protein n=1 Tax=Suillus paluster TaxID=48578 RepID=UPI001B865A4C|nr:uncharacterized protein EDB91DRAFT_1144932 [Suillus paluster]KAG1735336.1 hypothetical protein EDB91DRAFT_1144932 [Suillus paluster]
MSESVLTHARYGKDLIRVFRVVRDGEFHQVVEYNVTILIEGDLETRSVTHKSVMSSAVSDSRGCNLAKTSPHILSPERFALHLGTHIVSKYAHINHALVTLEKLRWSRIALSANDHPHPHSFVRDGNDKQTVEVEVDASAGKDKLSAKVTSGITDLLVLKSGGSAFHGYIRDEYTTLMEVDDRILSTSVDLAYTFAPLSLSSPSDVKKLDFIVQEGFAPGSVWDADNVAIRARNATLDIFALDASASVQATLFKMGQRVIAENAGVDSVTYKLPNKHYIPIDMKYIGYHSVFFLSTPVAGLISATISRK